MAIKDKEFWSNINIKGHLGRFFGGLTSKDYEEATDKTVYKRKVPLDDGTWKSIEDLGNSKETLTDGEITEDKTLLSPEESGTSYSLHDLFVKILSNIKYLIGASSAYTTQMYGQCLNNNAADRTVAATTHKKGTSPFVQVKYQGNIVHAGILVNETGDVTVEWAKTLTISANDPLYITIK